MYNPISVFSFTEAYFYQLCQKEFSGKFIDLNELSGCQGYCSSSAADYIRKECSQVGHTGIHFIDQGDYHYITYFFMEQIRQPFSLLLIDHHTDMQPSLVEGVLSCGNWCLKAMETLPLLKEIIVIGPSISKIKKDLESVEKQVEMTSIDSINKGGVISTSSAVHQNLPLYISLDKDVFSPRVAKTNWDQGNLTMKDVEELLKRAFYRRHILGMDVCGEPSFSGTSEMECKRDAQLNRRVNGKLSQLFQFLFAKQQ